MEEKEASAEHAERNGTQGEDQVAPAHVVPLGAVLVPGAAEGGNISPGKEATDQLTNRPPDTQHGQEVAGCTGQEFQEGGAINGQVTANTRPKQANRAMVLIKALANAAVSHQALQEHIPNPVRATACSQAESASQEQGGVESQTTTDNIRGDTPERGTDTQAQEESAGGESHMRFGNSKLILQRGQS